MPFYQALIDRFDVQTRAVEIQVAIVNVDVGQSRSMGLDVVQFLKGGNRELSWRPGGGDASLDGEDASLFTSLGAIIAGYDVAARLQAMESSNVAKTLSRPSVLTLDNIAAAITRSDQTYVKVAGTYSADLFTVSSSLALRVIPHVIDVEDADGQSSRQIKLFVSVEDGVMSATGGADGMPMVSSSQINTQAVLEEGQSLIVGGYFKEEHLKKASGVPFLKNLPVIGRLFSIDSTMVATVERLFIISPRIIELSAGDSTAYNHFFTPSNLKGKPILDMGDFGIRVQPPQRRKNVASRH
jgi:type III secretion protein C